MNDHDLSPEDQDAYESFRDPDDRDDVQENFPLDRDLQMAILGGLVKDRSFLLKYSSLIKPGYFTEKTHQRIADAILTYFSKYKGLPSHAILMAETLARLPDKEQGDIAWYKTQVDLVYKNQELDLSGREYVGDIIHAFALKQAMLKSIVEAAGALKKRPTASEIVEIHQKLLKSVSITPETGTGLDYFGTLRERFDRMRGKTSTEAFTTGIASLDASFTLGGLMRTGAYAIGAPSGDGKSIFLAGVGTANLLKGRRVLYVTCELSEDEVAQRFDSMLTGTDIRYLLDKQDTVIPALEGVVADEVDKTLLVVKQFAPKTLDVGGLQAYLDQKRVEGFVPDLLLVDYLGEMKLRSGIPKHEALEDLSSGLKGIAISYDLCLVSAIQINRDGKRAVNEGGKIDDAHLADSYGQVRPLDGFWTINRSDDERGARLARLGVAKSRSGQNGGTFYLEEKGLLFREIERTIYFGRVQNATTTKNKSDDDKINDFFANKDRARGRG